MRPHSMLGGRPEIPLHLCYPTSLKHRPLFTREHHCFSLEFTWPENGAGNQSEKVIKRN